MKRFVITRSPATAVVALGWSLVMALLVMLPITGCRAATVGYVALIVGGVSILLRERVLVPATVAVRR